MPNNFEVIRQNDIASAAADAGEYLNRILTENLKQPVLLLVSGGSAFAVLEYLGKTALGANLTVSVLDERFSQSITINNFAQLQKTDFYEDAFEAEASFFGTLPRKDETIGQLAERWEGNLKKWRNENPAGLVVATFGMGPDGHTAGIFPDANEEKFNALYNSEPWVVAQNVGDKNKFSERISTTLTFLKLVDIAVAFVCGAEKKEKLEAVIKNQGAVHELPALAWHEIKNFKVFTDVN